VGVCVGAGGGRSAVECVGGEEQIGKIRKVREVWEVLFKERYLSKVKSQTLKRDRGIWIG
jgi:hypothetical protein